MLDTVFAHPQCAESRPHPRPPWEAGSWEFNKIPSSLLPRTQALWIARIGRILEMSSGAGGVTSKLLFCTWLSCDNDTGRAFHEAQPAPA